MPERGVTMEPDGNRMKAFFSSRAFWILLFTLAFLLAVLLEVRLQIVENQLRDANVRQEQHEGAMQELRDEYQGQLQEADKAQEKLKDDLAQLQQEKEELEEKVLEQQRELEKLQPEEPGTQTSVQPVYDKRLESGVVQLILKNFRAMEDSSLADFKKTLHVKTNQPLPEYFEEIYNQYRGKKATVTKIDVSNCTDSTIKKGGYYALTTVVFNEKERLIFAVGVHKVEGSWYI